MKILLMSLIISLGACNVSQKMYYDQQTQVTLLSAHKEKKSESCGLPHKMNRTWHVNLIDRGGHVFSYHHHTDSYAKQKWLVPGDKYTIRYTTQNYHTQGKYKIMYANLKRNN